MKIGNKYIIEAIVFVSYVLFAMAWVGGTASMNEIMKAMAVDSMASASLLSGAVTLAKIFGTFVAAFFAVKLGIKRAFFVSAVLVGVGVLTPVAPNYELLLLSRFVMGLGGALMVVYFNPIVLHWFDARQRPVVNGLNAVAFNIGTAIVLWFMPQINQLSGGWQASLAAFSLASLLMAGLWLLVKFDSANSDAKDGVSEQTPYSYRDGLRDKFNWVYALSYG
ncbi:MAG: MFS transporter, partial [Psychrosphaera sp.]|nr:MFS transporter [Psychrosphaera sp.]